MPNSKLLKVDFYGQNRAVSKEGWTDGRRNKAREFDTAHLVRSWNVTAGISDHGVDGIREIELAQDG